MKRYSGQSFDQIISGSIVPVLVDFWAPWCGPCRMQTPILDDLERTDGDRVRIVKVNVDEEPALASRFGVSSIPTLLLFIEAEEKRRFVGLQTAATLRSVIGTLAATPVTASKLGS